MTTRSLRNTRKSHKQHTIIISHDTEAILLRVISTLGLAATHSHRMLGAAVEHLAESWDAMQDDREPAEVPSPIKVLLERLQNPDIGLPLEVTSDKGTGPRDLDGLIPVEYLRKRYPSLDKWFGLVPDQPSYEAALLAVRFVLTKVPEANWATEQTRSIVARAVANMVRG